MFSQQIASNWVAVNARHYSSLAALIFTLVEYVLTLKSEYKYIWKWRGTLCSAKGLYFMARYLGIITQIVNYILVQIYLNRGPVQPHQCRVWFIFLATSISVLFATFDGVLLLRVYALYRKNAKIYIIVVPLLFQYVTPGLLMGRNTFGDDAFNSQCDVRDAPIQVGVSGAFTLLAHVPLWFATFWKRHEGDSVELARLVVHEGGWAFGLLGIYIAGILPYCTVTRSGNPFVIFVLPIVALSIGSSRMIIHMLALKSANRRQEGAPNNDSSSIALTTYINTHFTIEEVQMEQPKDKPTDEQKDQSEGEQQSEQKSKGKQKDEPTDEGQIGDGSP